MCKLYSRKPIPCDFPDVLDSHLDSFSVTDQWIGSAGIFASKSYFFTGKLTSEFFKKTLTVLVYDDTLVKIVSIRLDLIMSYLTFNISSSELVPLLQPRGPSSKLLEDIRRRTEGPCSQVDMSPLCCRFRRSAVLAASLDRQD